MDDSQKDKRLLNAGLVTLGLVALIVIVFVGAIFLKSPKKTWQFQSIDTMKYSRDLAREKLRDPAFDAEIEKQIKVTKEVGATHVAIGTPYDKEFLPILRRWVLAARKSELNVWFRGNFSGWEGWFGYEKIDRNEHQRLLSGFITENGSLFRDGDIFTPCPECENGGPGDPRATGDVEGHQNFLHQEHDIAAQAFKKIKKQVTTGFNSMNYDVAMLIMDKETTRKTGGIVTIDHYVASPKKLNEDINIIAEKSGGKIVLGEIGVPIPDIHGNLSEDQQAEWLREALLLVSKNKRVLGINYWVGFGGSTRLWNNNASEREAALIVQSFFSHTPLSF